MSRESPSFLWDMFELKPSAYTIQGVSDFYYQLQVNTQTYGFSLAFQGNLLWNSFPSALKNAESSKSLKIKIKPWSGNSCT